MKGFKTTALFSFILFVGIAFIAFPADDVAAATKPAKTAITSTASTMHTITFKWKKSKGATSYNIYHIGRFGSFLKKDGSTKKTTYTIKRLTSNAEYRVYVEPVKVVTKKAWWNKKTHKWTTKKPAKKYRGKSKMVTKTIKGRRAATQIKTKKKKASTPTPTKPKVIEVDGSFALIDVPTETFRDNWHSVKASLPCDGKVSVRCSDSDVACFAWWNAKKQCVEFEGGRKMGIATITCTFIPASGYECSGNKVVTFTVTNYLYPRNEDGSYNLVKGEAEDGWTEWQVGGLYYFNDLPSGVTFRADAANIGEEYRNGIVVTVGTNSPLDCVRDSSNRNVVEIAYGAPYYTNWVEKEVGASPAPQLPNGMIVIGEGKTTLTVGGTKEGTDYKINLILTGRNNDAYQYYNLIHSWNNRVKGKTDYEKLRYTVNYICKNYTYDRVNGETVHDAMGLVVKGHGDCWAGNSLLYALAEEMGFEPLYRGAGSDGGGNGSGHVHCIINLNGVEYVADATPDGSARLCTWDEYVKTHPSAVRDF